jgi:hypothetical protein
MTNTQFDANQFVQTVVSFMERTTDHMAIYKMLAYYEATTDAIKDGDYQAAQTGYGVIRDFYDQKIN